MENKQNFFGGVSIPFGQCPAASGKAAPREVRLMASASQGKNASIFTQLTGGCVCDTHRVSTDKQMSPRYASCCRAGDQAKRCRGVPGGSITWIIIKGHTIRMQVFVSIQLHAVLLLKPFWILTSTCLTCWPLSAVKLPPSQFAAVYRFQEDVILLVVLDESWT